MTANLAKKYVFHKIMHINLYGNNTNIFENYETKNMNKFTIVLKDCTTFIPILNLFS